MKAWTPEELDQAVSLAHTGMSASQIGLALDRSKGSVLGKLQREGVAGYSVPPKRKKPQGRHPDYVRPSRAKPAAPPPTAPRRFSWDQAA